MEASADSGICATLPSVTDSSSLCAVCEKASAVYCPRCRLVGYCSHDHRLQHWDVHDRECVAVHPVRTKKIGINKQRSLIARNDFKAGSIIFLDTPIIRGPDDNLLSPDAMRYCFLTSSKQRSTCITCCSLVLDGRLCNKCLWQCCSEKCSQDPLHSLNECAIFHGKPETEFHIVKAARFILILRCLLTKENDSKTWNKILSLETNPMSKQLEKLVEEGKLVTDAQLKKQHSMEKDMVTDVMNQLRHFQLQKRFSRNVVTRIVNILEWNALPVELGMQKENTLLYPRITVAQPSCTPNGLWSMKTTYQLFCYARVDVSTEEPIFVSRVSDTVLLMSTRTRQHHLRNMGLCCTCDRCSSPTELGSHFSTVKCINFEFFDRVKGCLEGNLEPVNPCDLEPVWKCTSCQCTRSGKLVQNYMTRIQLELDEAQQFASSLQYREVDFANAKNLADLLGLKKFISIVKHHEGKTLHKNHCIIFHAKCFIIKQITKGIIDVFQLNVSISPKITDLLIDAASFVVQLCDECLAIISIVLPGFSLRYGEIIYHKQFCLGVLLPRKLRQHKELNGGNVLTFSEVFEDAKRLRNKARSILSFYRDDVEVTKLLEFMSLDEQLYSSVQNHFDRCAPIMSNIEANIKRCTPSNPIIRQRSSVEQNWLPPFDM